VPTVSSDLEGDLELARAAAREAGEILRKHFGTALDVRLKEVDQPVTIADLESDRALRERLLAATPGYSWVSEEGTPLRGRGERQWVVDPLDGTANFVRGIPEFAVSVGLVERGTPVVGVVYNPMSDELYDARRGGGAYRNGKGVAAASWPAARPLLLASRSELDRGEIPPLPVPWSVAPLGGTALKMARIADGSAHVYLSFGLKRSWDVCAGEVIAREAGAHPLRIDGTPIACEDDHAGFRGLVVVCRGGEELLPMIRRIAGDAENPTKE
jgi:myo-inositol-1(or 4)-monophosphatase